jgi:hypothetical protein
MDQHARGRRGFRGVGEKELNAKNAKKRQKREGACARKVTRDSSARMYIATIDATNH